MNDEQLIRAYRTQGDQQAFEELIRRYAGLVYATARRHVGDSFVAEDICQKVFCALATNLGSIRKPSQLPAWLYQTARRLAALHVRSDQRRVARERMAAIVNCNDTDTNEAWSNIEPLLNQGLDALGEEDRSALLLRFFRGMSMLEVAEVLGITEPAAKMRVGRAVEKLRTFFLKHSVTCSTAVLLMVLEQNASAYPPASVIGSVLSYVTKQVTAPKSSAGILKTTSRLRMGLILAVGVAIVSLIWFVTASMMSGKKTKEAGVDQVLPSVEQPILPQYPVAAIKSAPFDGQFRLTVLDETTAVPLAGVKVTVRNMQQLLGEGATDLEGHCDLPRLTTAGGDFYFKIRTEYDGYASMNVSWSRFQRDEPGDIPETFELKLPRGTRIGGVVVDENGYPLPGVSLRIVSYYRRGGPPPRTRALLNDGSSELTTTDSEGRWIFDRLPPDWEDVGFRLRSPDFLPAEYFCDATRHPMNGQVTIPKADLLALSARIIVRRGALIFGLVLDQNQRPISGVRVVQNSNWLDDYASTKTGSDGIYRIQNVSTGALTLSFQADNYSPQTASYVVVGPASNPPVVLAPGHQVRGRVLDPVGQPLEGVAIQTIQGGDPSQKFQWRAKTDANGSFLWSGAPDTPVNLAFNKLGYQESRVSMTANGIEQTVTLEGVKEAGVGIVIRGQVLDAATGQPIPVFKFFLKDGPDDSVVAKEGTGGQFSIRSDGSSKRVVLEVQAEGYEAAVSDLRSLTNGDQTVEFSLRRSEGWTGLVLLPNGQPAVGAEVAICGPMKGAILGKRRLLFRDQAVYQITDSAGRFHFDPVKDARMIVAIHQEGYEERGLDQLATNPSVRLRLWGRVEGVLRSSGHPVPNERVHISKRFWNPWMPAVLLYGDVFIVRTDANGVFAFPDVPPGDHAIGHLFPSGTMEARATVQVNPGETASVEVGGNGRPVTGKIHVPKHETGFNFSHSRGQLKSAMTKPVDLENVARRKNFASDEAYQQAAKSDAARRTAYWQSAEGLTIWRQARSYTVWFDADGTFHVDDVPPGIYDLNVFLEVPAEGGGFPPTRPAGNFKATVTVPAAGESPGLEQPADLGTVGLQDRWP